MRDHHGHPVDISVRTQDIILACVMSLHTGSSKIKGAKLGEESSVRADWPFYQAELRQKFQTGGQFFLLEPVHTARQQNKCKQVFRLQHYSFMQSVRGLDFSECGSRVRSFLLSQRKSGDGLSRVES